MARTAPWHAPTTMKTKICIIGCGRFARYAHGPVYRLIRQRDPDVEYAACADVSPEKAASFSRDFEIPRHYTDWREMAEKERPDGICQLTGVSDTAETACQVLAEGIPLLMEKPPGRNRSEIQRIIAASRRSNTPAMVAFNRRYSPIIVQMLDILDRECKEPVEHVRCDFYRCERLDADFSTTSIHGIDAVRHIARGRYTEARFDFQELKRETPAANIFMNARFDNGAYGLLSFIPSSGATFERYTIATRHWTLIAHTIPPSGGSEPAGMIEVFHDNHHLRDEAPLPSELNDEELYLAGYYGENAAYLRRLRNGCPETDDLAMSMDAVELADCIRNRRPAWSLVREGN